MTRPSLESPTVVTKTPALETPQSPPSPPPSREASHSRLESEAPENPFQDPSNSRGNHTGACRPTYSDGERFSSVFTDDSDELQPQEHVKPEEPRESIWRRVVKEWKLLLMLENSGSVARDHLASERTFLAYVRTSLTMSSAGVALVQLFSLSAATAHREDLNRFARPLGAVMIAIGLYTLGVGVVRYFLVQEALVRGVYPVARVTTTLLSFGVLAMVVAVYTLAWAHVDLPITSLHLYTQTS
ncbi:hypothetical protein C8Q78DRAFT_1079041 [Trametes maxima]|nr:hypothetical protein C8Q78DRAFT_1079041 [Trametes maxima]